MEEVKMTSSNEKEDKEKRWRKTKKLDAKDKRYGCNST
jgi:hypothetical protein